VVLSWNAAAERLYGYQAHEMIGQSLLPLFPEDRAEEWSGLLDPVRRGITVRHFDSERLRKDGTRVQVTLTVSPVLGPDGSVVGVSSIVHDRTETSRLAKVMRQAEKEAAESLSILDTLQSSAPVGFSFVDREFRFVRVNEKAAAINGVLVKDHLGRTMAEVIPQFWPQLEPSYKAVLGRGEPILNVEVASETAEDPGRLHFWLESLYPVTVHGEVIGVGAVFVDVTEQKAVEQEIEHSRRFLAAITDNMAEGMIATDNEGKMTFIDAAAERILGWRGDEVLGRSAHSTYHFQRSDGSLCPVEECPITNAWRRGKTLHVDHDTFTRRDGTLVPVAYSVSPSHTDQGGGSVMVFDDITERAAERLRVERELEKLNWVGRIRDALDQDRFVLYAQPIIDLETNAVVQHELLIRMVSLDGEIVAPDRFLPTAEEFGLISEIDRWVVNETARLAAQGYRVEFNLSAKSVVKPNMLTIVRNALETHRASPESVVCEITETALLRDAAAAEAFVHGLNDIGCEVALDDFGSGYSGFAHLKRLPVSYLKIEREFIRDLAQEASSRHVVSAVVSLAKAFAMQTVGEGAEDEATVELLKQLGVDRAQGYVIARPGPVAEVLARTT
jgi:PAS domain S-box-containing protein